MVIGIDASRAAREQRTGVEEYSYQLLRHLARIDKQNQYRIYTDKSLPRELVREFPENFEVRVLPFFRFWTQVRLAWELLWHPPDVLWVPASAMPIIHPRQTVVTIHGLEFEHFPEAYTAWQRWYLRFSTKYALKRASKLIAVSENTKRDLVDLYKGDPEKITVVPNAYAEPTATGSESVLPKFHLKPGQYFFFYGRLEKRKNLVRLIKAFAKFRQQSKVSAKLVLAGNEGVGIGDIKSAAKQSPCRDDIIFLGFLSNGELYGLLNLTRALVFPSLYEGFGIPVLEAFSVGTPVLCSNTSSLPEVGGDIAVYFDPLDVEDIADKLTVAWRNEEGLDTHRVAKHLQKFDWQDSARRIQGILNK